MKKSRVTTPAAQQEGPDVPRRAAAGASSTGLAAAERSASISSSRVLRPAAPRPRRSRANVKSSRSVREERSSTPVHFALLARWVNVP